MDRGEHHAVAVVVEQGQAPAQVAAGVPERVEAHHREMAQVHRRLGAQGRDLGAQTGDVGRQRLDGGRVGATYVLRLLPGRSGEDQSGDCCQQTENGKSEHNGRI